MEGYETTTDDLRSNDKKPMDPGPDRLQLIRDLFRGGDPITVDIGQAGEHLTARIRLALIAAISIIPVKSTILEPEKIENWIGMSVALFAMALSFLIVTFAARPRPPRGLAWVTTQFDVAMVTLGCVGFIASGRPIIASNNFVHFSIYLLAIMATALRADPVVSIAAGASAGAQHLIVNAVAARMTVGLVDPGYGTFSWDHQVGRLILILLATLLVTAVVQTNRNYWRSSVRDKLTGLHNRRFFDEFLEYKVAEARRHGRNFALVFLDVDNFKQINDEHGHTRGDLVLEKTGRTLTAFFRDSDVAARHGGEEFTIVLPESNRPGIERRLIEFQAALAASVPGFPVTASIGVAFFPEDGKDAVELVKVADRRMYEAKARGRNRVVL